MRIWKSDGRGGRIFVGNDYEHKTKLPSMKWLREQVPIGDLVQHPGLKRRGKYLHCWHPEKHKHGDRTPSVGIDVRRNKVHCFVCGFEPCGHNQETAAASLKEVLRKMQFLRVKRAGAIRSGSVGQSNHLIKRSRCLTYRSSDDGVNYVYDEMPALRSDRHESEAPGSVHVCSLWLGIDTDDCQQVESLQCDLSLRSNGWRWRHFPCWTGLAP
jgi:hypothetical protein